MIEATDHAEAHGARAADALRRILRFAARSPYSLFRLLDGLPLGLLTSLVAVAVIVFFFVTSSDSGSLVIDILASGGDLDPPKP